MKTACGLTDSQRFKDGMRLRLVQSRQGGSSRIGYIETCHAIDDAPAIVTLVACEALEHVRKTSAI